MEELKRPKRVLNYEVSKLKFLLYVDELEAYVDKLEKAIDYIPCCETLKDKEETVFDLWLKNFKHAERDLYWYNEDTLYCIEAMKDIYNTEVKPTL